MESEQKLENPGTEEGKAVIQDTRASFKHNKKGLTPLQASFCRCYVKSRNGRTAVELCGSVARGASADAIATKWLRTPQVIKELARLDSLLENRAIKSAEDWEREIDLIAFQKNLKDFYKEDGTLKPISELTEEQCAILGDVETTEILTGRGSEESKSRVRITSLRRLDKLKALDMKAKRLGIYKMEIELKDPYMAYIERLEKARVVSSPNE